MVLWDDVLDQVMPEYDEVTTDRQHVDAAAMNFVRCPHEFDVVVASNLFGDILTDLAGAIVGGWAWLPAQISIQNAFFPRCLSPVLGPHRHRGSGNRQSCGSDSERSHVA